MARRSKRAERTDEHNEFLAPEDDAALVAWLERKRELGKTRLPEFSAKLNLAYVLGQQDIVWDSTNRTFVRASTDPDDPNAPIHLVINKVGGIVERFISRLTKAAPEPETRPVTDDEDDIGAAKAATRILRSELQRLTWESWLVRFYFWVVTHGFAYAQVTWDASDGAELGEIEEQSIHVGNIALDMVPEFELSVDPDALDMSKALYCTRTRAMSKAAIWEQWGVVPDGGSPERSIADEVYGMMGRTLGGHKPASHDAVAVHQFWMLPCRAAPEGMVVTYCGNTVLEERKPFPYKRRRLPFVQFDLLPGMGTREGRTWVSDLLSPQADYNDARSREAETRRTVGPKLVADVGDIDTGTITSRIEIIERNGIGEKPSWMIPDSGWLAPSENAMNRSDMEMGDRAGQSDVSSGKPQSASMPAAAILALQEADDTKMAISAKLMADAIEEVASQMLGLVRQFWAEERLVATYSEEGNLEVSYFRGADIEHQLDVHVAIDTGVARSKSAMVQLALDLWKAGIITDPRQLLRFIKVPGTDFMLEAFNIDTRQAQRENEYLVLGTTTEVHDFDDHMVHITEHNNFRKSAEYDKLKRAMDAGDQQATAVVAAFDSHVMGHYQLVLKQMGVPTPPGTQQLPPEQGGGGFGAEQYMDPLTGAPPNPMMVAAGQAPSALSNSSIGKRAGIGGPGQPGAVPGVSADAQAASMGR